MDDLFFDNPWDEIAVVVRELDDLHFLFGDLVLGVFDEVKDVDQVHVELVELLFHLLLLDSLFGRVFLDLVNQPLFDQLLALVLCAFCEGGMGLAFLLGVEFVLVLLDNDVSGFEDHLWQVLEPFD